MNNTIDSTLYNKLIAGRAFFDGLGKSYAPAKNVLVTKESTEGVDCFWFRPNQPAPKKLIVYLHGGGYAWGSIHSHEAFVSHLSARTNVAALFVEYSLAPEHPYPQALNDVLKVYRNIIQHERDSEIYLIGDSAGGGLTLLLIAALQKSRERVPDAVVMISPWINLNADTPSYTHNASIDPILTLEAMNEYASAYNPAHSPEANPASIHFKTFPPLLIITGSREILLDDSKNFYEAVSKIQPESKLHVFKDQTHVWLLTNIEHVDSRTAIEQIKEFVHKSRQ